MGTYWGFEDLSGPFRGSEAVATGAVTSGQLASCGDHSFGDAALRAALIGHREMQLYLVGRHDRGIVQARRALELADPRAESRPNPGCGCTSCL